MRKTFLLLVLASSAVWIWACNNGDDTPADAGKEAGSGTDAGKDSTAPDAAKDSAADVAAPETGGDSSTSASCDGGLCCFQPADCIDGGDQSTAYPPDSGVVCCATLALSGNDPNNCSVDSLTSACSTAAACASNINVGACSTNTLRGCKFDGECVEQGYDKCCSFVLDGGTAHVCANDIIAAAAGGSCP